MKILIYSDLHLEFKSPFRLPENSDADILILAGDIITFKDFVPLENLLKNWIKPVLFVAGNHEYYTNTSMQKGEASLLEFIKDKQPNLTWLNNTSFTLGDVEFFGGTMWTDFGNSNPLSMYTAGSSMNDYRYIRNSHYSRIRPEDTVKMHSVYKTELLTWLEKNKDRKRVVISHHAPTTNPNSFYRGSKMQDAYNSLDMESVIEEHQYNLHIYGHTHESDDQLLGKTRVVSNPFGYYNHQENPKFDSAGLEITL